MGVEITGVDAVIRAIGRAKSKDAVNIATGLTKCANMVLKNATPLVPLETGALRKSGHVVVTGSGLGAEARVEYGGPEAPYALYVHEDLTKHHPVGQAKWLEAAGRKVRGAMAAAMKREVEYGSVAKRGGEEVP